MLTLNLKSFKKKYPLQRNRFRKGIVLVDEEIRRNPAVGFEASVAILHHSSTIHAGYESVMHSGVIR